MRPRKWLWVSVLVLVIAAGAVFLPVLARLDYGAIPERASWQLPDRVVASLDLEPGAVVADIGAGDGYFTFRLADAVGTAGRVYAVEVSETLVAALSSRVEEEESEVVEAVLGELDDPKLPRAVDLAFVCNVYHHIDDRVGYFSLLRRYLSPGGRVAIVEVGGSTPARWLSPPGHATAFDSLVEEMSAAGYRLERRFDFLPVQDFAVFAPDPQATE